MLHLPLPLTMAETGVRFFGIVRVPLTRLEFVDGVGERLYDRNHTDHLKRLFKELQLKMLVTNIGLMVILTILRFRRS